MIRITVSRPQIRKEAIRRGLKMLDWKNNPFFSNWGLNPSKHAEDQGKNSSATRNWIRKGARQRNKQYYSDNILYGRTLELAWEGIVHWVVGFSRDPTGV